MSKVIVTKEKIVAVADAIREKASITDSMTLDEMPSVIEDITTGGGGGVYDVTSVGNDDGTQTLTITTSEGNLPRHNETVINSIYEYYGVDREGFPFVYVYNATYGNTRSYVYFCKCGDVTDTALNCGYRYGGSKTGNVINNISDLIDYVTSNKMFSSATVGQFATNDLTNYVINSGCTNSNQYPLPSGWEYI